MLATISLAKSKEVIDVVLTFLFVVSGLIKSSTEVFIHDPWDLSNIMSVEDDIPRQVLSCPL